MKFCHECLEMVEEELSLSDRFILNIIAENKTSNKEDIVGLVKVMAKRENEEIVTSKSGITSILSKLNGALLINVNKMGRQKLYSVSKNGQKILERVSQ